MFATDLANSAAIIRSRGYRSAQHTRVDACKILLQRRRKHPWSGWSTYNLRRDLSYQTRTESEDYWTVEFDGAQLGRIEPFGPRTHPANFEINAGSCSYAGESGMQFTFSSARYYSSTRPRSVLWYSRRRIEDHQSRLNFETAMQCSQGAIRDKMGIILTPNTIGGTALRKYFT